MSKKVGMIALGSGLILIFGLLVIASFIMVNSIGPAPLTAVTATSTPEDAIIDRYRKEIEGYDQELKKTLSPEGRNYYEGMKKYAETKIAERRDFISNIDAYSNRKATVIALATLSPIPKGKNVRQPGLLKEVNSNMIPGVKFFNGWVEAEGDSYIIYLAGCVASDPDQGVIYLIHDATWTKEKYVSPSKDGAFKIKGFEKKRLILTTSQGKDKYFDTQAKKYADTLDGPVVDVTPTPIR